MSQLANKPNLPRNSLILLMASVLAAMLPHSGHLPWLFAVFAAFVMSWRWLMFLGRFPYPGKWAKTVAVILTMTGIFLGFLGDFSVESATAFFVATCLLKMLEMKTRRDGYVVCFLAYFLSAAGFLFEQGLLWGLYGLLAYWLITTALVSIHLFDNRPVTRAEMSHLNKVAMGHGSILVLSALPMMLILYLVFPRFGPLWNVGLKSNQAQIGLSSQVTPGDIANLSSNNELVMRVTYKNPDGTQNDSQGPPASSHRYWRALVLDQYEDRTWKASGWSSDTRWFPQAYRPPAGAEGITRYEIIQESSGQKWLYTLRNGAPTQRGHGITETGVLVSRSPVFQRIRYEGVAFADYELFPGFIKAGGYPNLDEQSRRLYTRLDEQSNPQTRQWADSLSQEYEPVELVNYWLNHFRDQPYFYSLSPPQLGQNDIDEFLFQSRSGFCAHYAGALTFLARAAGIPARMVVGYQGGEWDEQEQYLTIRQYDAHGWVELWLDGRGWVRVDPTSAVSPERVDLGMDALLNAEDALANAPLLSERRIRQFQLLNSMMREFERLNYAWYRWVLSYDQASQRNLLTRWTAELSWRRIIIVGASILAGLVLLVAGWRLFNWYRHRPPKLERVWQQLRQRAELAGIHQTASDTPLGLLGSVLGLEPEDAGKIHWLRKDVERLLYMPEGDDKELLEKRVIKGIKRLIRRLPKSNSDAVSATSANS